MPLTGMEPITVPGAFDGWVTLLDKHGTMKLADLLAPAIDYAENGFPVDGEDRRRLGAGSAAGSS